MTAIVQRSEVPIAYSMVASAGRIRSRRDGGHLYQKYFLYWTAFDDIYTAIARREGYISQLKRNEDGVIVTVTNGSVKIPEVDIVSESDKIRIATEKLGEDLKHTLILHDCTAYFVGRIPSWQGVLIEYDGFGQRVNGVIKVGHTSDSQFPVWSPIDIQRYEAYKKDPESGDSRNFLARQILDLLHTIRKNYLHSSKKFDDANDLKVVENGLQMLEIIVTSFLE